MKNTAKFTLMSALVLSGLGSLATTAHAAEEPMKPAVRNTDAQVKFTPSDDPTDPVDPTDPTNPVDPIDPTDPTKPVDPGTEGPLSLDYASSFDFGVQKITSTDQTYQAKAQMVKAKDGSMKAVPNYAQVTDNRGTLKGWSLSVKQNGQFTSETSKKALTGATINIANASISTASESKASVLTPAFTLDATGASQLVMGAKDGEGAGTFVYQMGKAENVKENANALKDEATNSKDAAGKDTADQRIESSDVTLKVPGGTQKMSEKYATTLTWTLTDAPANDAPAQ
ncbi:WxL domain-containing protein [Lactococcus garvieae]|uniref:WxL domain-containing protein n=1 Tax=Lactococcus garvieae TaxID=1363 RepID=UPI0002D61F17|nr:WxL domain-containing protein [Lactococcus garvieae]